jgi:hypothetical protein
LHGKEREGNRYGLGGPGGKAVEALRAHPTRAWVADVHCFGLLFAMARRQCHFKGRRKLRPRTAFHSFWLVI